MTVAVTFLALLAGTGGPGGPAAVFAQTVSFSPSESLPTDLEFTIPLVIDCAGEQVKAVEVLVTFDPLLVRLDAITPGSWYTGSGQEFFLYDYTGTDPQGTLHLASAVLDGSLTGAGELAICHFTIVDFGVSPLVFQDLDVRSPLNVDLGFSPSEGDRIIVDPVVSVQAESFGAIKAIYR